MFSPTVLQGGCHRYRTQGSYSGEMGTILQVPGTGSNHKTKGGRRDSEKTVSKVTK